MILDSIELRNVGPFREKVRIGPLDAGLNILAALNEAGKSTFVKATARGLFDRHTSASEEIKELRPVGTSLAPSVAIVFKSHGRTYRIEKTFFSSPRSQFSDMTDGSWRLLDEADQADKHLQALLGSGQAGRGATKPEHWGLFQYLWAWQGEPVVWPKWRGDAAKLVRSRLVRVELDPLIESLKARLADEYGKIFTPAQGQPMAGGPLASAEKELEGLEGELEQARLKARELEELQGSFQRLNEEMATLAQEAQRCKEEADETGRRAREAELLLRELQTYKNALETAKKELHRIEKDLQAVREAKESLERLKEESDQCGRRQQELKDRESDLERQVSETDKALQELQTRRVGLQAALERTRGLLKIRGTKEGLDELQRRFGEGESQATEVSRLQEEKSRIPALTSPKLVKLQRLDQELRELDAGIKAAGITMDLTPDKASRVEVTESGATRSLEIQKGVTETISSGQALGVHLQGWGDVRVRSGAGELKELEARREAGQRDLSEALAKLGVENVEQAASLVEKRRDLDNRIREAERDLKRALGDFDDLASLKGKMNQSATELENLRKSLDATSAEEAMSLSDLEAQEEALKPGLKDVEKTIQRTEQALKELADSLKSCREDRHQADTELVKLREKFQGAERMIANTQACYPEGMEATRIKAGEAFTEAKALVEGTERKLPPNAEKLPEHNRRAALAASQAQQDLERRKEECNRLHGRLEALGAEGLYSRETKLLEDIGVKRAEAAAARRRGWAARLVHDLMERRKQAATREVLTPLQEKLSSAFAELTGAPWRRVFLDENLQIRGAGRSEEELVPFELLSQGAKEQLMLALRLAVGQALTEVEPQSVILDDVLVNTDPVRQARVLDVLQTAAQRLQILVLTCHPDHYRGVGKVISIEHCDLP